MGASEWIVTNPDVLAGKPCVSGTRLSVAFLLELVASGASRDDILKAYPLLPREGLEAALRYAADALNHEVVWDVKIPA
jgi:uncharacterized protein (DUF433 family)